MLRLEVVIIEILQNVFVIQNLSCNWFGIGKHVRNDAVKCIIMYNQKKKIQKNQKQVCKRKESKRPEINEGNNQYASKGNVTKTKAKECSIDKQNSYTVGNEYHRMQKIHQIFYGNPLP